MQDKSAKQRVQELEHMQLLFGLDAEQEALLSLYKAVCILERKSNEVTSVPTGVSIAGSLEPQTTEQQSQGYDGLSNPFEQVFDVVPNTNNVFGDQGYEVYSEYGEF